MRIFRGSGARAMLPSNGPPARRAAEERDGGERPRALLRLRAGLRARQAADAWQVIEPCFAEDAEHRGGHESAAPWQRVAGRHAGVSVNDWTDEARVEGVVGQSILNGVPVELRALPAEAAHAARGRRGRGPNPASGARSTP